MRFFTRAWLESDDAQEQRAYERYRKNLESIQTPVGLRMQSFDTSYNLHDALLDSLWFFPLEKEVRFAVVEGDNSRNYRQLVITYRNADFADMSIETIKNYAENRTSEILYDEFDRDNSGRGQLYVHRFLLWPGYQSFGIVFDDFSVIETPLADRRHTFLGQVFDPEASTTS